MKREKKKMREQRCKAIHISEENQAKNLTCININCKYDSFWNESSFDVNGFEWMPTRMEMNVHTQFNLLFGRVDNDIYDMATVRLI